MSQLNYNISVILLTYDLADFTVLKHVTRIVSIQKLSKLIYGFNRLIMQSSQNNNKVVPFI